MEPGEVISKPAFSLETGRKFSIEICPFDPMNVIPSEETSIFIVERIGIAFLLEMALLVVFNAWRKAWVLIEKWIMILLYLYSYKFSSNSRLC